ncbi:hypothetical protein LHJ74_29195 [Streptomyces sp. N2-109]|uniref:Uncharacterized protein n=1 Tax=Streptomyces gossypii TaxID=2883101 RepID=A0ABT2K1S3_9ACTN|nr:hypothetical protein [Streptomyces gossypii]MCT2593936.1 hypothetical protein [Streptomyces gossypii]
MNNIDGAVEFFKSYLEIEHAGNMATYSESDETVEELRAESMQFWHALPGIALSPSFGRPMGMQPERLSQLAQKANLERRALFLVAEYRDPAWGTLYAGFVGGDRASTAGSYGGLLYAAEIEGGLKVVASYREDFDKAAPPVQWRHSQGAEPDLPGAPVAVRALQGPTGRAEHREDWEILRGSAPDR